MARFLQAEVEWHAEGQAHKRATVLASGVVVGPDSADLNLSLGEKDGLWSLSAFPVSRVFVDSVAATFEFSIADADALYLNGYNSWTDSIERKPNDRMRNFGVPKAAIRHWVLDGSGDYRFVEADERPGHQHGFGYGYLRFGDQVSLFGSTRDDEGMTLIREDLKAGTLSFTKEGLLTALGAQDRRVLAEVAFVDGTLDQAVERWLALSGVSIRKANPVVGYSSWYRHYTDIDEAKLEHDLEALVDEMAEYEHPGCDRVFQVDDGYTKVGDWLGPDPAKFPQGLSGICSKVREQGMVPGIWIAPFVCERDSRVFSEHPEWLLRGEAGELVVTGSHWSGQVAFDTRNPGFREHITNVLRTYTEQWGFVLLKCDFLYGACMLPHDGMNRGQLMADALDLIRQSVAEGTRLDLCGVPIMSALGRCEYCRIGCDVGLDWDGPLYMRKTGRERVSTKNSMGNTIGRAHLDGRAFRCDPDVFFLRKDVKLTDEQRSRLLEVDSKMGGVLFTSDDMSAWDSSQSAMFRNALSVFSARAQS